MMPITTVFAAGDTDYIQKLNQFAAEHNASTGEVLAVGAALAGQVEHVDAAVVAAGIARDEAVAKAGESSDSAAAAVAARDAAADAANQVAAARSAADQAKAVAIEMAGEAGNSAIAAGEAKDAAALLAGEAEGSANAADQAKDVAVLKAVQATDAAEQALLYAQQAQASAGVAATGRIPGETMVWPGAVAPAGWALCNGQLFQIADHPLLHSVLGAIYGGDGVATFAVPDLRGRLPLGASAGHPLGSSGGADHVDISVDNMPSHAHGLTEGEGGVDVINELGTLNAETTITGLSATLNAAAGTVKTANALGNALLSVNPSAPPNLYVNGVVPSIAMHSQSITLSGTPGTDLTGAPTTTISGSTDAAGSGEPLPIMPPYLAVNYIIFLG